MTALEKNLIFNLLKNASDNFYGYFSPEFSEKPQFKDDKEAIFSEEEKNQTDNKKNDDKKIFPENPTENSEQKNEHKTLTMQELNQKILGCSRCELSKKRTHIVPGQGVEKPEVLIIGEGPGAEEDAQGLPFVGPAGQLLDKMLSAIQLDRFVNCYIANTVKCRPPYNRDPQTEEAEACRSFLDAQIHILKPKMILALGKVAVRNLLKIQGEFSLNRYRGKIYDYNGIPLVVTYHPSALLRNIEFKRPAWEDLKFFRENLLKLSPDYAKDFKAK